jgi:hypothetical protein
MADEVCREPQTDEWREAWAVTEAVLYAMAGACRGRDVLFGAVTLSNARQVHPDAGHRAAEALRLGVPDLLYPDRRVALAAGRVGVPVLTLAPLLADSAARSGAFLHGFDDDLGRGHWNEAGHREAGLAPGAWVAAQASSQTQRSSNQTPPSSSSE